MLRKKLWVGVLLLALGPAGNPSGAQTAPPQEAAGSLSGRIVDSAGEPVAGATVEIVELHRSVRSGEDGRFVFTGLAAGSYLMEVQGPGGEVALTRVRLDGVDGAEVTVTTRAAIHQDQIVVSASADPRSALEVAQPVSVLDGAELTERQAATLGETLAGQPGVATTWFGPGSSRPILRGQGGERVRTLTGGLGSADAAAASPDHAVAIDPAVAESIEVLRGPATLRYGSSAIGGVVNVLDERIPLHRAEQPIGGTIELRGGTNADERSGVVALDGGGGRFAWHADFSQREADDLEVPDGASMESGEDHDHDHDDHADEELLRGFVDNTSLRNSNGAVGFSWIGDRGLIGVSVSGLDHDYGVPGHVHGGEDHDHDPEGEDGHDHDGEEHDHTHEDVRIDLRQRRVDLESRWTQPFGAFRGLHVRLGRTDYEHRELEGTEIGTVFTNEGYEGRIELLQRQYGRWSGSLGVQFGSSDFVAAGQEAFVPPSVTDTRAVFAFQRFELGDVALELGARGETVGTAAEGPLPDREFDLASGSLGVVWTLSEGWALSGSLARTERAPSATELYADGAHLATRLYEVGDPDLGREVNNGADLALKASVGRFRGQIAVYESRYDGYIYEQPTGEVEDGLDVIQFVQRDTRFRGFEIDTDWHLLESGAGDLDLELRASSVRAVLRDRGEPLPRIPPLEFGGGLAWRAPRWSAGFDVRRLDGQDRVAAFETPTPGATLWGATLGTRWYFEDTALELTLRGENLGDAVARVHSSYLKDLVPLPGRNLRLIARWIF